MAKVRPGVGGQVRLKCGWAFLLSRKYCGNQQDSGCRLGGTHEWKEDCRGLVCEIGSEKNERGPDER